MSNISVGQIIVDAQRMAARVKDLDVLGSALLLEAENNNRLVENLRRYQEDIESLNRISNNKTNADIVNRIQQQNSNCSEILKENRELKICLEDYERAMELMMQKYREHVVNNVFESKINFKEVYSERLWKIIGEQREKINEMAAVMQRAANADDDNVLQELEIISRLRLENETLREMLQISKQYGTQQQPIRFNELIQDEKAIQTDIDDSADELSLSVASVENMNNNTVIQVLLNNAESANVSKTTSNTASVKTNNNIINTTAPSSPSTTTIAAKAIIDMANNTNTMDTVVANINLDNLSITKISSKSSMSINENNNGPEAAENCNSLNIKPNSVEEIPLIKNYADAHLEKSDDNVDGIVEKAVVAAAAAGAAAVAPRTVTINECVKNAT